MAWFRCSIGGSGGLELTVTCDSSFAGLTITCTDGDTTLTKTCPSQSPYQVVFNLPNGGTWTISGQGVSTTVVVPETTELHVIPTGSSVTPINDIQTWLHCGNIWNKTHTTIAQVLADTTTLLALISSNNAADYMARSTSWASSVCANSTAMSYIGNNNYCANKLLANSTWLTEICNSTYFESILNVKVPTMTSNTTPSGVASADATYWKAPYAAFDGTWSGDNGWGGSNNGGEHWVAYEFTQQVMVKKVVLHQRGLDLNLSTKTFRIDAYNGSTWVALTGTETMPQSTGAEKTLILTSTNSKSKYTKFRLYVLTSYGSVPGIGELQFYGRA